MFFSCLNQSLLLDLKDFKAPDSGFKTPPGRVPLVPSVTLALSVPAPPYALLPAFHTLLSHLLCPQQSYCQEINYFQSFNFYWWISVLFSRRCLYFQSPLPQQEEVRERQIVFEGGHGGLGSLTSHLATAATRMHEVSLEVKSLLAFSSLSQSWVKCQILSFPFPKISFTEDEVEEVGHSIQGAWSPKEKSVWSSPACGQRAQKCFHSCRFKDTK